MNYVQMLHVGDRYIFRLCIGDEFVQKETTPPDADSTTSLRQLVDAVGSAWHYERHLEMFESWSLWLGILGWSLEISGLTFF